MEKIIGLIDAPFTPFYENGEVNYEPIEAYAKMLAKNGLKGVFINGSSGEGYMLTEEERMKLAERWMEVAPEGFKVIVHVGSCCVKASKMLAEHAQKIGAWGIGAMAPKGKQNAGRTCPENRCMGYRCYGSSISESRTYRRVGEILRRNCSRGSEPPVLLLSHSGIQRCFPANDRTVESCRRTYSEFCGNQIYIRKYL